MRASLYSLHNLAISELSLIYPEYTNRIHYEMTVRKDKKDNETTKF